MHIATEPHRKPLHDHFKNPTDGVPSSTCLVDARNHALLCGGVWAAEWTHVGLVARARAVRRIHSHAANLGGERPNLNAECV